MEQGTQNTQQGAQQSMLGFLKTVVRENKWLVAFIVIFLTLMLFPLIFRGGY